MMAECFFAIGAALDALVNVETLVSHPPHVLPEYGGMPMPLLGGAAQRALSGRLRRSGHPVGVWVFDYFEDDAPELETLLLALYGNLHTTSKQLYVSTIASPGGHYSPFLCHVDGPYVGQSMNEGMGGVPLAMRFNLVGGVLQSATKTGNATIALAEHLVYVDTSGGSRTMTLPPLASVTNEIVYSFVKTSASNNLVLDPDGSEQIDGASTKTVTALNARADIIKRDGQWVTVKTGLWAT